MDFGNFSDIFTMQTLHMKKYKSCINIQMNNEKCITNLFPREMNSKETTTIFDDVVLKVKIDLQPLHLLSHLWRKKRQSDEGEKHPEVLLSVLDIVAHPHHQSLKNGFLIGDVDVITGEQFNNVSCGEQQELLVLNDLQEVFLEHR